MDPQLLAEKLAAVKQFAAGAGHELNNPLAIIAARAQALLQSEDDPERRRLLEAIEWQAFRAHGMIADLMLFAAPPPPEFTSFSLVPLVTEIIEQSRTSGDRQETVIQSEIGATPNVHADRVQLGVAIHGLILNGLEALGRGGHLVIRVVQPDGGDRVHIEVEDDGPGLTETEYRHMYDPFFSGRQAGRGLGFGLSKAWRIATDHGGELLGESRNGKGSRFTIVLPISRDSLTPSDQDAVGASQTYSG